jgi:hypothetical protein
MNNTTAVDTSNSYDYRKVGWYLEK